ncbi:hypothetical protein [uncultured Thioclava sp.]|jgi:hypothetical protein|uniref:hypothetical protein n=1 Tax=uncultured Thioclava sp. TaxID=473858 RepID=UPI0025EBA1A8|nr:hypothetical protein [uncultured Thioclava sp.]
MDLKEWGLELKVIVFIGWIAVLLLPLMGFGVLGFQKWKRHYGADSTVSGYFFRYVTGKTATDDPWKVYALKIGVFLGWIIVVTSIWA